jgi:DNA-binding transcriptional regulator GbsR (MarR family)
MADGKELRDRIFSTFADVATSLGYSPLHGKIIGALLVEGRQMSLQELAKETGYSTGMISLSLDLLEVVGVIRKAKRTGDRKLYVELQGDLLASLKNALVLKVRKAIDSSLSEFEQSKSSLAGLSGEEKERSLRTLSVLEKEIKRLEKYVNLLSRIKLP